MAKKKKEVKEEKKKETVLTIPLRDVYKVSPARRARSAVISVKSFIKKNLKKDVKFTKELNEFLWKRGARKPPRKIRVKLTEVEDTLTASIVK